ncbi:MAG: AAA family ATPase [Caulobacter sp.]|nr:AAA family ATPase [Caulobacter sp.]
MWLETIILKDFRCFFGEHQFELSQDREKNVTLIHAENGVGKTTLLNALLWCFYAQTTGKFEMPDDLVNHDAKVAGRKQAYVEVLFEHNGGRYRARRYTVGSTDRTFTIMRLDQGHHHELDHPDAFINSVMPRGMAGHFLFDGEHAEVFTGDDNRKRVRQAVQDILGCSLVETAISDLEEASTTYRRQAPSPKSSSNIATATARLDALAGQIKAAEAARDGMRGEIETIEQQIADIEAKLRDSAAAKELQIARDKAKIELSKARKREADAQDDLLKWLGENGRFLVSTRITALALDHLDAQETKGRIPSPYNEEFVQDLLDMELCVCGAPLHEGSEAHAKVKGLLQKAANATLRSRLTAVRGRLAELKREREKAPARLADATKRLAIAREDVSRIEADLSEISGKLLGVDFDDIREREKRRNELRTLASQHREQVGAFGSQIQRAEAERATLDRDLKKMASEDADAKIFIERYTLCQTLKGRLERELAEEERSAKQVLRASIERILDKTSRKAFRLKMTDDYVVSLVNAAGTRMPKSGGENQLLGLIFTAALVEYAKLREHAKDVRLLKGTIAPLVLDSPFGQLDDAYRATTAEYVPEMAGQVVLMVSRQQGGGVLDVLRHRIGQEYVLVRHNKDQRGDRKVEIHQLHGRDIETSLFDQDFDGTSFVRVSA